VDLVDDDNSDGFLDVIQHIYDACNDKYSRLRSKFDYACGPPVSATSDIHTVFCNPPYGQLRSLEVIDPALGPETEALFDDLLLEMQMLPPDTIVMSISPIRLCDIDWDGDCDSADIQTVKNAVGKCWGESGYCPLADIDGDGCVSDSDIVLIFEIGQPDLNYDGLINFSDFAMFAIRWLDPNCESANIWCDVGDLNTTGRVDFADCVLFSQHWLEGTTP
jgi:hypothetical protein